MSYFPLKIVSKANKADLINVSDLGLNLLHSERPKLYTILTFLSAIGLNPSVIVYNFGLSECNRVKPEQYTILAFMSAIGIHFWPF